jgi:hypothetical protein
LCAPKLRLVLLDDQDRMPRARESKQKGGRLHRADRQKSVARTEY